MSKTEEKTVLSVVYDPAIGRAINRILTREDFNVEIAKTSEEAREKINGHLAVITDWTQVDGEEVVRFAKEKGVKKIIVMDGGLIDQEKLEALKKSGVDIIPKPFNFQELISAVRGKVSEIGTGEPKS